MANPENSNEDARPKIAIFASPECTRYPRLYKPYFNVAWFVRAYRKLLENYTILTTEETKSADERALESQNATRDPYNSDGYWDVPAKPSILTTAKTAKRRGFDGPIWLMDQIVRGEVERVLMFMDPFDTKEYLPETYAFIRNCTLAEVGLHINAGATYWAESVKKKRNREQDTSNMTAGFGGWRTGEQRNEAPDLNSLLNPNEQMVHFIAHDSEKEKLARFVYYYRGTLANRACMGWKFSGTSGTCRHIEKYLAEHIVPYWDRPPFKPAGAGKTGHGPSGGDVVIAAEVSEQWPVAEEKTNGELKVTASNEVRKKSISHTVLFFIDYLHARPHESDVHVLLRTCLNPYRGVQLILNERSAIEWGETIRDGCFSGDKSVRNPGP